MKSFINTYYSVIFILFLLTTVGLSFYLGYEQGSSTIKTGEKQIVFSCPNTILDKQKITGSVLGNSYPSQTADSISSEGDGGVPTQSGGGAYVGSKNGTKYYTPGCPGSKRIKPENYVWFQSVQDATLQGYSKGSC